MMRILTLLCVFAIVLLCSLQAHAALLDRGTDSLGNKLIYDTDLDITWYDYTSPKNIWQVQMDWAGALDVNLGGTHFTDWRLPTTVDGEYVWGYNGTTTAGYNITSSEMGHLFYTELLNKGYYTPTGACLYDDLFKNVGLKNTGDFQNLQNVAYWSSTTYLGSTNAAWKFSNYDGGQYDNDQIEGLYAIAVRPGDVAVAVAPEPISMVLFGTGGIFMAACRKLRKAAA